MGTGSPTPISRNAFGAIEEASCSSLPCILSLPTYAAKMLFSTGYERVDHEFHTGKRES